jgi:hypothetical protein
MKVKRLLATGGVAAVLALSGASVASATPGHWDCEDFNTPVVIVGGYDPEHLDQDNDGIGCEDNPGEPMAYDLYANLKGDEETTTPTPSTSAPELAETGWGPGTHPLRWYAASGALVAAGGVVYVVGKKRATR